MSFRGVEAWRNFRWGFDCAHCGKTTEKDARFTSHDGTNQKAGTVVTITPEGEKAMTARVMLDLIQKTTSIANAGRGSKIQPPKDEKGICPYCRKPQHWAPIVLENANRPPERIREVPIGAYFTAVFASPICSLLFMGCLTLLLGLVEWLIGSKLFPRDNPDYILRILFYSWVALSIGGILLMIYAEKSDRVKLAENIATLNTMEKKEPYLISIEAPQHKTIGMSVRY